MLKAELLEKPWATYVEEDVLELLIQSVKLLETGQNWKEIFHDYSFVVFPAAKAYEGFLKKMFYDLGFITREDYYGKRFRIGKALNPDMDRDAKDFDSIYDRLLDYCHDSHLADQLWNTWKECRNSIFHWFPEEKTAISITEAHQKIEKIIASLDAAFEGCKLSPKL